MYQDFFNEYYKKNKPLVLGNSILTISIYPIEIIFLSWLSGMIFIHIKQNSISKFWLYLTLFFILFLVIIILYYFSEYLDAQIVPSMHTFVRKKIYELTTNKQIGVNAIENGEMITKLLKVPHYMFMNYMNMVTFIIPFSFAIIFFVGYMFYINWRIGVISIVFFILFAIAYAIFYQKLSKNSFKRYYMENIIMNEFEDVLKNNENIVLNSTFDYEKERLFDQEYKLQSSFRKELEQLSVMKLVFVICLSVFMFGIVFYASYLMLNKKLDSFKLVMLVTSVLLMLRSFTNLIRRCTETVVEFGPLMNDKDFGTTIQKALIHNGTRKDFFKNYLLEIDNVSYSQEGKVILQNINISIPFKSNILITGEIGAGKSTLIKLICGYFHPTQGSVSFDGVDIKEIDIEYLRGAITMMHQHITLFKRNVFENIFYGLPFSYEEQLKELQKLSIYSSLIKFIDTKDATTLSGGQKQIVLLLRCWFRKPKILILDEPTANVDPLTKKIIIDIIVSLKSQMTIICVSHDASIYSLFQDHFIMDNGVILQKNKN
jgi:ATP-binding cassette subfamily B protein/subfamily B ATP-binding cassette protein MsbA